MDRTMYQNLRQLKEEIKSKKRGKPCASLLLLHDHTSVHLAKMPVV